jgi:hypothetical protein
MRTLIDASGNLELDPAVSGSVAGLVVGVGAVEIAVVD